MAKQAKIPQTEWTRSGMDISRTATPYYQSALSSLGNITNDPNAYRQQLQEQYYGPNSAYNQDFLRQYNRAMGNATANNYAATSGGLSSSAQRAYNDQQRYYNDLRSRLLDYGVQGANSLMSTDVNALNSALGSYNNAYNLGSNYSKTEQQNSLADQANRNWWGNLAGIGGTALGAIAGSVIPGVGTALGASLGSALGNAVGSNLQTDIGPAMAAIYGGNSTGYQTQGNVFINPADAYNVLGQGLSALNISRNPSNSLASRIGYAAPQPGRTPSQVFSR